MPQLKGFNDTQLEILFDIVATVRIQTDIYKLRCEIRTGLALSLLAEVTVLGFRP